MDSGERGCGGAPVPVVLGEERPAWNLYVKYDANEHLLLFDSTTVFYWCFLGDAHSSVSQEPDLAQRPPLPALSHDPTHTPVSSQVPGELRGYTELLVAEVPKYTIWPP